MDNRFKPSQLAQAYNRKKHSPIYILCGEIERASGIRVAPDTFRAHLSGRTVPNADHLNAYVIFFKKPHSYFYKETNHAKSCQSKSGKPPHS